MEKRLIIIDGNSIINRAFYALPDMSNSEGLKTNAIFGFVRMMFKIIEDYQTTGASSSFGRNGITLCNAFGPPVEQASATSLFSLSTALWTTVNSGAMC